MKKILRLVVIWLISQMAATAYAVECASDSMTFVDVLSSQFNVPANSQEGTVLWQEQWPSVRFTCTNAKISEEISFWVNPDRLVLGAGVEPAIIFNGRTYTAISGNVGTGVFIKPGETRTFTLSYTVAIIRKGVVPPSGVTAVSSYPMFQMDGAGGLNYQRGLNFRHVVTGGTFHYAVGGCKLQTGSATKAVSLPATPMINTVGGTAGATDFSIRATCDNLANKVSFQFSGPTDPADARQFRNTAPQGAQNIAINLVAPYNGITIPAQGGAAAIREASVSAGTATLNLRASYIRTASPATAGPVSAQAEVTVTYN
ncbi:Fimbrial protein [compost metagenome]|jgi:type 1 fimbria pilin|nr:MULTISPECIES: fimbrial protein [Cupriavidus]URF04442.1 type 1 fimbrial protein [Cupriavidus campinensis]CAG2140018.1 hypothetical protein LMG19282_01733 [Cupriavidus campinensis]